MSTFVVLTCTLTTLALAFDVDWSEILNETNSIRTCRTERDSCSNLTSPSPSENINRTDLWTFNCFCDADCWRHGDCCLDKAISLQSQLEPSPQLPYWTCEMTTASPNFDYVYMVTSCPPDWPKDDIRNKCDRFDNQITDYTFDLDSPVVSRTTNTTYANVYCAQCHHDTDLETMQAQIDCNVPANECVENLLNASYAPTLRLWGRDDGFLAWFHMPQLVADNPFRLERRIRMCRPSVDQCDPQWPANTTETHKCRAFASYIPKTPTTQHEIFDPEFPNVFKNHYCAKCNYVNLSDKQECDVLAVPAPNGPTEEVEIRSSFALLLDFNSGGGRAVVVGTVSRCRSDQVYDSLHDKCVDLPCGRLFDAIDGSCKANTHEPEHGSIYLNDSCPKSVRNASEVTKLSNGSIVLLNGRIYHLGQYEVQDDVVLVCNDESQFVSKFSAMQSTLSLVVLLVSVFFLSCHITVYGTFSKLRNLPGKSLVSLSVMLLCGQVLFFGVTRIRPGGFCEFIAVMMHFCFLSSFFWMNVMAVDICRTFTVLQYHLSSSSDKKYKQYASYAWGFSALIVISSIIVDNSNLFPTLRPNYGNAMCWISQRRGLLVFFAVPLGILLVENVVFFVLTARGICRTTEDTKCIKRSKQKVRFFLYVKLALIMGFTWVSGFVAALAEVDALWYGFIVLNGLQGTFIFFAFSFKKKVWVMIKERYFSKKSGLGGGGKAEKKLSKSQATSMSNLNTTCTRISTSNLNVNAVNAV